MLGGKGAVLARRALRTQARNRALRACAHSVCVALADFKSRGWAAKVAVQLVPELDPLLPTAFEAFNDFSTDARALFLILNVQTFFFGDSAGIGRAE